MSEKKEYKYFGAVTRIEGVAKLSRLGQPVMLEEEVARQAVEGGAALLPADRFDSIGFTAEEMTAFPLPADAYGAPLEFQRKRDRAYELREQWLAELRTPAAAESTPGEPVEVTD